MSNLSLFSIDIEFNETVIKKCRPGAQSILTFYESQDAILWKLIVSVIAASSLCSWSWLLPRCWELRPCLAEDPAGRRTKYFYLDSGGGAGGVPPVAAEPEPAPSQTPAGERWWAGHSYSHTAHNSTVEGGHLLASSPCRKCLLALSHLDLIRQTIHYCKREFKWVVSLSLVMLLRLTFTV